MLSCLVSPFSSHTALSWTPPFSVWFLFLAQVGAPSASHQPLFPTSLTSDALLITCLVLWPTHTYKHTPMYISHFKYRFHTSWFRLCCCDETPDKKRLNRAYLSSQFQASLSPGCHDNRDPSSWLVTSTIRSREKWTLACSLPGLILPLTYNPEPSPRGMGLPVLGGSFHTS